MYLKSNYLTNPNFLNKPRCATLSGVFETQTLRVCPTEQIICVKEDLLRKSPNSLTRTFLNANIKLNLNGGLQEGCNSTEARLN